MEALHTAIAYLENKYQKKVEQLNEDAECKEYFGYNFEIGSLKFKFRLAKRTPKKNGVFVALWKRGINGTTQPYHEEDSFDFYIFYSQYENNHGFFLFSKQTMTERHIISTSSTDGKRGFRLYPKWEKTSSKQAEKTQNWQCEHYIKI